MMDLMRHAGHAVYKRAIQDPDNLGKYELPSWAWAVFVADIVLFAPILLFLNYSIKQIYPVFAIVEDENPPAYEPVPLEASVEHQPLSPNAKPTDGQAQTVSSSLRAINRLLRSQGGSFFSNFRGLACFLFQILLNVFLIGIFAGVLGNSFLTPVATLLASLSLVSFSTAWVHIVISVPSERRFWQRLPPFSRVFKATWKPVTLYWAAREIRSWLPLAVAAAINLDLPDVVIGQPAEMPEVNVAFFLKGLVVFAMDVIFAIFVIIPTHVILVRIQASLLPPEEDAIIPLDRSFEGQVQTALVGGRGFATISEAWHTFTKAAWRRLIILYIKIGVISTAVGLLMALVIVPEAFLIARHTHKIDN